MSNGSNEHPWLLLEICIRMHDTQQFVFPGSVKVAGMAVLFTNGFCFPMSGFALVAAQAIISRVN
jgi:hypothetical protein